MAVPKEIIEAMNLERRRLVGIVLAEYAKYKLAGEDRIASVLDQLATALEHDEPQE